MAEKILVTQALDERDLLVKRINDRIRAARFADTIKRNEEKVLGERISEEEFRKQAESMYQQIMDLINRFNKLDAAIIVSNAQNYIETSQGKLTVAGAISLRNRLNGHGVYEDEGCFEMSLAKVMERQHSDKVIYADQKNAGLESTAKDMRLSILGRDGKAKEEKPLAVVEAYIKENTTEVVDPLNIAELVRDISEKREKLLRELDTGIKVSNATTFIEV